MNSSPGSSMDLDDRQLSEVDTPAAWRRLGFAVAVSTIGSVGMWSMPVALPFVQADFDITRAEVTLPYTLAMTGFALGGVAMGRLCDRFGVVVAIMLGNLALGISYVGASLAPSPLTFALMHLFIGVGASGDLRAADGRHVAMVRAPSRDRGQHRGLGQLYRRCAVAAGVAACDGDRGLAPHLSGRWDVLRTGDAAVHLCTVASASDRVDVRSGEYRLRAQSWCFAQRADGSALRCGSCLLRGDGDAAGPHRRLL